MDQIEYANLTYFSIWFFASILFSKKLEPTLIKTESDYKQNMTTKRYYR